MPRQYRTLGELRTEMRAMIGAAASGSVAGPNATLIDTHLRNAQVLLYWTHDWAHLRRYWEDELGADQHLLDYPSDSDWTCNPDRIKAVSVLRGGVWSRPLPKGIPPEFYTTQENKSWPQRWEPYDQMEFWPIADQAYDLRIFGIAQLARFTQDNDRASIDDVMISTVATATLKAHYRQPDAATWKDASDALLIKLRGKSWGKDVFKPGDFKGEPLAKPQTI